MARLRVHAFTLTLDGFGSGTDQRADAPFGDGVEGLHDWMSPSFRGEGTGVDDAAFHAGSEGIGATIMGRTMFGPVRGAWPDEGWRGTTSHFLGAARADVLGLASGYAPG